MKFYCGANLWSNSYNMKANRNKHFLRQRNSIFCCLDNENHRIFHFCSKRSLYWMFASLRVILNFIPQNGYIHPDEFFQFVEVASGDAFDIDVYKPWEFNVTFPVRNSLIPQLCVRFPYMLLQGLNAYCEYFFGISLKSPYFLVLFPRLAMTILSFASDYCLYKICLLLNEPYVNRLTIFSSSYIMLIHCTRTLSNSVEMILTSVLIYRVSRCMELSSKVVVQSDYLTDKYCQAKSGVERTKIYKLQKLLPPHSLNDCLLLSAVTVFGIFNRPTFIAFAGPSIFFWLQRGLGTKSIGFAQFHSRFFLLVFFAIPVALALILYDSLYFGYLSVAEISSAEISLSNFVVTPFNFLKYNSVTSNLKNHGLHPRFLHFLVNVPLLFNVVGVISVVALIKMLNSFSRCKWLELPQIQSIESLMISSFAIPVALLSVFPHQEPRFIIPVLLPLVFLYAHCVEQPSEAGSLNFARGDGEPAPGPASASPRRAHNASTKATWYLGNVVLAVFYGFVHQGGVLPLTSHLSKELKAKPYSTHVHLVTSHTYPIPTALLHLRNTRRTYKSDSGRKYTLTQDFYIDELGSSDVEFTHDRIARTVQNCEYNSRVKQIPYRLYYALPFSFYDDFKQYALESANNTGAIFKFRTFMTFYPHLSMEKPPKLGASFSNCVQDFGNCVLGFTDNSSDTIFEYFKHFNLLLLRIEYNNINNNNNNNKRR